MLVEARGSEADGAGERTPRRNVPARLRLAVANLIREHRWMTLLLAAGLVLRVVYTIVYWPAFFVLADSQLYVDGALSGTLDPSVPFGYSALLAILYPFGSLGAASVVQHLLGLGTAVAVYAFARHRGIREWLAVVAAAGLVLDPWQVAFEQYLMSDTLFTTLLVAALVTLLWRPKPGPLRAAAVAVLLAAALLTRTVGLAVVLLVLAFLVVRWAGWRPVVAFAVAFAAPVAAYAIVYHAQHGVYALGENNGRRYYGRAAQIVDCDAIPDLTERERRLCPTEPRSQRLAADEYGLFPQSPAQQFEPDDPVFESFTNKVFRAQPGDLAAQIGEEFLYFFSYGTPNGRNECLNRLWVPTPGKPEILWCYPHLASRDGYDSRLPTDSTSYPTPSPFTRVLKAYSYLRTPPWALLVAVLFVGLACLQRLRTRRARQARDGAETAAGYGVVLLAGCGLALLAAAVVGAMYDARYAVPATPLLWLAGVLAIHLLARDGFFRPLQSLASRGFARRQ